MTIFLLASVTHHVQTINYHRKVRFNLSGLRSVKNRFAPELLQKAMAKKVIIDAIQRLQLASFLSLLLVIICFVLFLVTN